MSEGCWISPKLKDILKESKNRYKFLKSCAVACVDASELAKDVTLIFLNKIFSV